MTIFDFSDDQRFVVDAALAWRGDCPRGETSYLTIGGFAGTGKTSLVSYLVDVWPNCATAALCGKAAHVLRSKGADAQTLHSLMYVPFENDQGKVRFRKKDFLDGVRTIVVDEASMVDHLLFEDLLSYRIPVLFVGDHGQLEPIGTNPNLMKDPKLRLEKIHRQAMGNPILRLATAFREGRATPYWSDPKGRLILTHQRRFEDRIAPDVQVLCGFNKTRHQINAHMRKLLGYKAIVEPGEKLICLKNNKTFGIFNGQQMTALKITGERKRTLDLNVQADDGRKFTLPCLRKQFGADALTDFKDQETALLDYGWCLTVHKSQGSEWPEVLVVEEIASVWDVRRWRYTAATRAKERLVYCA